MSWKFCHCFQHQSCSSSVFNIKIMGMSRQLLPLILNFTLPSISIITIAPLFIILMLMMMMMTMRGRQADCRKGRMITNQTPLVAIDGQGGAGALFWCIIISIVLIFTVVILLLVTIIICNQHQCTLNLAFESSKLETNSVRILNQVVCLLDKHFGGKTGYWTSQQEEQGGFSWEFSRL